MFDTQKNAIYISGDTVQGGLSKFTYMAQRTTLKTLVVMHSVHNDPKTPPQLHVSKKNVKTS